MPRKKKERLFGLFDEQAVSILMVLVKRTANFSELVKDTGLSKASLSRTLKALEEAAIAKKTTRGYVATKRGKRIIRLILALAEEDSEKMLTTVGRRLRQMEAEYRSDHRIFHSDPNWERTAEKALMEVIAVRNLTGAESLLFQQRFLEETARE